MRAYVIFAGLLVAPSLLAQAPETGLNPTVRQIVDSISEERIVATLRKLETFGTRFVLSTQEDPAHGIGAARQWIFREFQSYSPRLQVSYNNFTLKKEAASSLPGMVTRDVDLANVVAELPGTIEPDRYVLVTAHYDSINMARRPTFSDEERAADLVRHGMEMDEAKRVSQFFPNDDPRGEPDYEGTAKQTNSPGVTDDGSGTAAVLELARIMSQYRFDKSLVFIAFASEEAGLQGSKAYAEEARQKGLEIETVLNNDIIGSDVSGNGRSANGVLRVFADGPDDSPHRTLQRYFKQIAERHLPSMRVQMVFHRDRFGRGGDQNSCVDQGIAAVRLTTPSENYTHEHSAADTFENAAVPYTTRVTKMNAAVLASLALAPSAPITNYAITSGERKGLRRPMLSRGKTGYDAALRWLRSPESDVAGYAVVIRSTTAPDWERQIWVGDVTQYTIPDLSIDDVVIGVKAVDRDGNQSLVSVYLEPFRPVPPSPGESGTASASN